MVHSEYYHVSGTLYIFLYLNLMSTRVGLSKWRGTYQIHWRGSEASLDFTVCWKRQVHKRNYCTYIEQMALVYWMEFTARSMDESIVHCYCYKSCRTRLRFDDCVWTCILNFFVCCLKCQLLSVDLHKKALPIKRQPWRVIYLLYLCLIDQFTRVYLQVQGNNRPIKNDHAEGAWSAEIRIWLKIILTYNFSFKYSWNNWLFVRFCCNKLLLIIRQRLMTELYN